MQKQQKKINGYFKKDLRAEVVKKKLEPAPKFKGSKPSLKNKGDGAARIKKLLKLKRVRKNFKLTTNLFNPTFQFLQTNETKEGLIIDIKIKPNNVFCTLKKRHETLYVLSAGKCSAVKNVSKKTLRYKSQLIIKEFLRKTKDILKKENFLINIVGTKKIKALTLRGLAAYFKKRKVVINIDPKKCFNGCRPPKKRRKRQKGIRVFK